MKQKTSAVPETGNKCRTTIDYSGKTIYVGIDIHKKDWQVGLFYEDLVLGNHRIKSDEVLLVDLLQERYPGASFKCVYESGAWGFTLQRALSQQGIDCIVVHAGDVPGSDKEKKNKTDKVDALRLARHHASGNLNAIHVPDELLQKERSLIRYRKSLRGDLNRAKNRLKSLLKFQGIVIAPQFDNSHWSKNFIEWVRERTIVDKELFWVIELKLEQIESLRQLLLKAERRVRELMRTSTYVSAVKQLTAIPGIGPLTSSLFLLEIGDIRRFKGFDALNCFVGFYPGSDSSGEKQRSTGLSNRKHTQLRTMLIEAAWKAIAKDPAMLDAYKQLTKRMEGTKAIIRIARKLLRRMRSVLLSGQEYQKGVIA